MSAAAYQRRRAPYVDDDEELEAEMTATTDSPRFDDSAQHGPRRPSTMRREDSEHSNGSSASSSRKYSDRRPAAAAVAEALAPPTLGEGEDDIWEYVAPDGSRQKRHGALAASSTYSGFYYAPLVIALAPPLGALLGGSADSWTDAILVLLSGFWLYQFLRVPNDVYTAARTRRVLQEEALDTESTSPDGAPQRPIPTEAQRAAMAELRRTEVIALLACVASPLMGAKLLEWVMVNLEDGTRFLNHFNIRLFMLAAGIKPWSHALSLLRRRVLHLQETVHYPSLKVETLTRRLNRLESEHASLRKLVALKTDVRLLRDGIDVPLTQLSRTLRRYEKKEENLRLNAEDKFALIEGRFEDLLREVAVNAELINMLERQQAESSSFPASILSAIKVVLGRRSEMQQQRHYLQNMPRALPSTASLGITGPTGAPSGDTSSPTSSTGSPPYRAKSLGGAMSQHHGPPQPYASPPRYHGPMPPPTTKSATSPSWYQSGLAYWALLPLNISTAVLQTAKEKMASPTLHHYHQQAQSKQHHQQQQHKLEGSPFLAPPTQLQPSIVVQPAQNSPQPSHHSSSRRERERDRERLLSPNGLGGGMATSLSQLQQPVSPSGSSSSHRRKSIKSNGSRRM